jgi:hypothetical protein
MKSHTPAPTATFVPTLVEPRISYERKNAAKALSISVRSLDYLIASGKFVTRRLGKKVMIPIPSWCASHALTTRNRSRKGRDERCCDQAAEPADDGQG